MASSTTQQSASYQSKQFKDKDEVALDDTIFNMGPFLQTFMRESGYDFHETQVFSCTFLSFMHNSLFYLAQCVISMKKNLSQNVDEMEKDCINEIYRHNPLPEIGTKIDRATKLMKLELPQKIKQYMLNANFQQSETKENHDAYVSMVSNVLISGTSKFLQLKERLNYTTGTKELL